MTFESLLAVLQATGIPFADTAWENAPTTGCYGTLSVITEGGSAHASNRKRVRVTHCAVDLYVRGTDAAAKQKLIEQTLHENRVPWSLSDRLWDDTRHMVHFDWNAYTEDRSWL